MITKVAPSLFIKFLAVVFIVALALSLAPLTIAQAAGNLPAMPAAKAIARALYSDSTGWSREPLLAFVPVITATKTYKLSVDSDGDGQADPGDRLRYTITIANRGSTDALNTLFNDTIDNNTTFVPGSLQTTPLARNDSYSTVGNVQLIVSAANGVLANDSDPDGTGGLTISSFNSTSANGGQVSLAANGSFTYNPPPGFSGTDTFTYTMTDGESNTNNATVSITVGQVIWFINNTVAGPGDGRFTSPFNSIANFNSLAADDPGDYIFVYQGSGAYSGAITLLNTQQLIGHGVGLTLAPNLAVTAASRPTLTAITLGAGNTVRGLNVSTNTGAAISGASVGALTINNVSVTNTGGVAVNLSGGASSMAVTFDSVSASGGANGVVLTNNAGSFTSNGGTIDPTTGHGIAVTNTATGPLNFTLTNSTITGAPSGFNGVNFAIPTSGSFGTINITGNTISNNGSSGVRANIQGTGSIAKIDIGSNTFTGNDTGVDLATNGTANVKFDIHHNGTMTGTRTQVNLAANDVTHNNGVGPTMEGYIRNNTITTSPTGSVFIGMWVVSDGDGNITVDINNNTITNFGESGIAVESRGGTGDVNARIANNSATTTASFPLDGMFLRSGNGTLGETSLLCVNLSSNNMNGGSNAVADYYLDRFNPATTVFQIQGLTPSPATAAQAQTFVVSTDSPPPATAFAENGTYTAATCATVSFAAAASTGSLYALTPELPLNQISSIMGASRAAHTFVGGSGRGLASPLLAPITPVNLGALRSNETVTIIFDVTINDPLPGGVTQVSNQGAVSGSNFSPVLTDDPATTAPNDPTVTPIDLITVAIAAGTNPSETGPTPGTFAISLTSPAPAGGLTVNYNLAGSTATTPADYSLAAGSNVSALSASTFTVAGGASNATINIVPVDDLIDDDGETVQMTLAAGSGYGVSAGVASRTIIDNDSVGASLLTSTLTLTEPNTIAVFMITLASQPTAAVIIDLTSTDTTECSGPASVSLNSSNWFIGAPVIVTAVDDTIADGPQPCTIVTAVTQSADPLYNGTFNLPDVTFTVNDNDIASAPNVTLFLPLILKSNTPAPDLTIDKLTATSSGVSLTLKNIGNGPVTDAFWVDVYFNPSETPRLNKSWSDIADYGAVWGVTGAGLLQLAPGGALTLTPTGPYYFPDLSSKPPLPVGQPVYGLVDSVDFGSTYGAVWEGGNENNNLFGPVNATDHPLEAAAGQPQPVSPPGLPPRR